MSQGLFHLSRYAPRRRMPRFGYADRQRPRGGRLAGLLIALTGGMAVARAQPVATQNADQPADDLTMNSMTDVSLDDLQLLDLEIEQVDIAVTAGRRPQKIATIPHAITVLTAEDIRRSGARNIPDALRLVPGVNVADTSWLNSGVSTRGGNSLINRSLLVLVDGRQIFDSLFGGTLWGAWPIQLEDIARIEVIRGPAGVTWGANAMNGVINIITKDPRDQQGLTLVNRAGSRGWSQNYVGYGFSTDQLRMRISGQYEHSDGFYAGSFNPIGFKDDLCAGKATVFGVHEPSSRDRVTFSLGSANNSGGYPPPPTQGFFRQKHPFSQTAYLLGKWEHKIEKDNTLTLTGYFNDYAASPGHKQIDYRYHQFALQIQHSFTLFENNTFTWGIDNRTDMIDASNADPPLLTRDRVNTSIIGFYMQDEWRLAEHWTLNLGGRIDYEFYTGWEPSMRASLSYQPTDNTMFYGAISRAFTVPPAGERFTHLYSYNGLSLTTADEELDFDSVMAYELGFRGHLLKRLDVSLNLYWHEYADIAELADAQANGPELFRQNIYASRMDYSAYGTELGLKYKVNERLNLRANYTYELLDRRSKLPITTSADGIYPPKHKFMIGAEYDPRDDLRLSSYLYYVDTTRTPFPALPLIDRQLSPYFRLDLRAEYDLWENSSVAVGVRNLLDNGHLEGGSSFMDAGEVPRTIYAEWRLVFQ